MLQYRILQTGSLQGMIVTGYSFAISSDHPATPSLFLSECQDSLTPFPHFLCLVIDLLLTSLSAYFYYMIDQIIHHILNLYLTYFVSIVAMIYCRAESGWLDRDLREATMPPSNGLQDYAISPQHRCQHFHLENVRDSLCPYHSCASSRAAILRPAKRRILQVATFVI